MNALVVSPFESLSRPSHLLYQSLVGVRQAQPGLSEREWASLLEVSEAELQVARIGQEAVYPLQDRFSLLYSLSLLGDVELEMMNDLGVAHWKGRFNAPDLYLDQPQQLGLRFQVGQNQLIVHLEHWYWACAVEEPRVLSSGVVHLKRSLCFYNRQGQLFFRIQVGAQTNLSAWQSLMESFTTAELAARPLFVRKERTSLHFPADAAQLEKEWRLMQAVDDLPYLLQRHETSLFAALLSLSPKLARPVGLQALEQLLSRLSQWPRLSGRIPQLAVSLMTSGLEQHFKAAPLAPCPVKEQLCIAWEQGGCLHLDRLAMEYAFIVRQPCDGQWISHLALFDADGQPLCRISCAREPGQAEDLAYRHLLNSLQ